jgi:hypothetical protein
MAGISAGWIRGMQLLAKLGNPVRSLQCHVRGVHSPLALEGEREFDQLRPKGA